MFILTHLALSSASSLGLGGAFLFSNSRCHQRLVVVLPPHPSGFRPRIGVRGVLLIAGMTRWAAGAYPGSESGTCFHSDRSCRLVPAHQGMKSGSSGLVQRIGTADSATPHPDPSGGQAPRLAKSSTALHFLIPPSTIGLQFGRIRRWRAGIEVDWRAHPGSESGTCFRTNRSCRLAPAHQGVKTRSCDLVWRVGTADSATPHPDPSGGQAPALHFLIPPSTIGLQLGRIRRWRAGIEFDWRAHPGS